MAVNGHIQYMVNIFLLYDSFYYSFHFNSQLIIEEILNSPKRYVKQNMLLFRTNQKDYLHTYEIYNNKQVFLMAKAN